MKLSELRPCASCGGTLDGGIFYIVWSSVAVIDAHAANRTLGLTQFFGGTGAGLQLAEAMGADADCVKIGSDVEPNLKTFLFLCTSCYCADVNLAVLAEKIGPDED